MPHSWLVTGLLSLMALQMVTSKTLRHMQYASSLPFRRTAMSIPLQGHSHNDEDASFPGSVPLLSALLAGLVSVEADTYLVDGACLVGHDALNLTASRTLEAIYLQPLARLVAANGGVVHKGARLVGAPNDIILLVDSKLESPPREQEGAAMAVTPEDIYNAVELLLWKYQALHPGLFTVHHPTGRVVGAVTVIMSGARPPPSHVWTTDHKGRTKWLMALDGRLPDLFLPASLQSIPSVMPMVSQGLYGSPDSALPDCSDQAILLVNITLQLRVKQLTQLAHKQGRLIRFWDYSGPALWRLLLTEGLGVDLANVDGDPGIFRAWALTAMGLQPMPALINSNNAAAGAAQSKRALDRRPRLAPHM